MIGSGRREKEEKEKGEKEEKENKNFDISFKTSARYAGSHD